MINSKPARLCNGCNAIMPPDRLSMVYRYCTDTCRERTFTSRRYKRVRAAARPGYIYVLWLSTNTIKVGRANDIERRMKSHHEQAAMYGVVIKKVWHSDLLPDSLEAEFKLRAFCASNGRLCSNTNETFTNLSFDTVVIHAAHLSYSMSEHVLHDS